mgnify:CR=1 FL=1
MICAECGLAIQEGQQFYTVSRPPHRQWHEECFNKACPEDKAAVSGLAIVFTGVTCSRSSIIVGKE